MMSATILFRQDLSLRCACVALETCLGECGLDAERGDAIELSALADWVSHAPKGPLCIWIHLLDLDS